MEIKQYNQIVVFTVVDCAPISADQSSMVIENKLIETYSRGSSTVTYSTIGANNESS